MGRGEAGRGGRGGRGRRRSQRPSLPTRKRRRESGTYVESRQPYLEKKDRKSPALEEYYTVQKIVPEAELQTLFDVLAVPLPTSFRVTVDSRFCSDVCDKLDNHFQALFDGVVDPENNEPVAPPRRMPWYPDGLAWTVSTPRFLVRRNNVLAPFHKFLVQMHELGAINRQEAVSMIPPLLLDVQPHQSVLDLCAAPGSKTAQLLETIATSPTAEQGLSAGGLVIANDADIKRCWMLAHQLRRFAAPHLMVTHHDAQAFPNVTAFDRVLCDVPCTGDGTLRKAPDMWRKWTPQLGNGIHRLQKNILRRGVELLKPGGRIVYSTCSMNPVENEAVVADALRHFGPDTLELIDVSDQLPLLKRRPGLTTWRVKDTASNFGEPAPIAQDETGTPPEATREQVVEGETNDAEEHVAVAEGALDAADGVQESTESGRWFDVFSDVPARRRKRVVESLFPPSAEEIATGRFPLSRCLRLVPHDQDTGAFFVAVLEKKGSAQASRRTDDATVGLGTGDKSTTQSDTLPEVAAPAANDGPKESTTTPGPAPHVDDAGEGGNTEHGTPNKAVAIGKQPSSNDRNPPERQGSRLITDDPLVGLDRVNEETLKQISEFFGIDEARSRVCLMTRGSEEDRFKRVLLVSPAVREMLKLSLGSPEGREAGLRQRLRVVNAGVRVFERTARRDATVPFRILSDGVRVLRPYVAKRVVSSCMADVEQMLMNEAVEIRSFKERTTRNALNQMQSGSAIMVMGNGHDAETVLIWKGQHKVTKLMPSEEVAAMKMRHGLSVATNTKGDTAQATSRAAVETKVDTCDDKLTNSASAEEADSGAAAVAAPASPRTRVDNDADMDDGSAS